MIKKVGDTAILSKHRATCHCGSVVLELDLPDGIVDARRCNCSVCRRKGAVMGAVPLGALRVVQGQEQLTVCRTIWKGRDVVSAAAPVFRLRGCRAATGHLLMAHARVLWKRTRKLPECHRIQLLSPLPLWQGKEA